MERYNYPEDLVAAQRLSEGSESSAVDILSNFLWVLLLASAMSLAWFIWGFQSTADMLPLALFLGCLVAFLFAALGFPNPPAHLTSSVSFNEKRIRLHLSLPWLYRDFAVPNIRGSKELKPAQLPPQVAPVVEKYRLCAFKIYHIPGNPRDFHGCKNLSDCLIKAYGAPPYDEPLPVRAQTVFLPASLHGKMKKILENAPIPDSHLEHIFG